MGTEPATADHDATDKFIDGRLDHWLDRLATLVNQPSISSQNVGLEATADVVAGLLEESGFDARVMPSDPYPVVYAESNGSGDRTLLCYNHYDVQPPEPLELWDSPPFEARRRNGKMFGRGIQDDKGQLISRLAAIDAVKRTLGELPCRIKFIIEGGEEIASPGVPEFVQENQDLLQADACVWETGGVGYDERPIIILGLRGICYIELRARALSRDAHSGMAHVVPNAAWRLIWALVSIKDRQEHILVDGFYDDVIPASEAELAMLDALPDECERTCASYGIQHLLLGRTGAESRREVFSPTASVDGLSAGYEGPGSKTIIPAEAMAKMDFRLVPDQDPVDICEKIRAHLRAEGFEGIEVEYLGGERPGRTPVDDPFVQMTIETAQQVYGSAPRVSPLMGGSGPVAPFRDHLRVPVVTLGISHPDSMVHGPNEHIRIDQFVRGTRHMARLVERFGRG